MSGYGYLDGDLVLAFTFWRATHPAPDEIGEVFVARIPPAEFTTTVVTAIDLLASEEPPAGP